MISWKEVKAKSNLNKNKIKELQKEMLAEQESAGVGIEPHYIEYKGYYFKSTIDITTATGYLELIAVPIKQPAPVEKT